jgi:hypothetical protein
LSGSLSSVYNVAHGKQLLRSVEQPSSLMDVDKCLAGMGGRLAGVLWFVDIVAGMGFLSAW